MLNSVIISEGSHRRPKGKLVVGSNGIDLHCPHIFSLTQVWKMNLLIGSCLCCLHCSGMFVFCVTEDAARHNPDQPPGPHPRGLTPGLQLSCWWPRGTFIWPCLYSCPRACLRHHHRPPRHSPGRDSHEDAAQEPWLLYCKLIPRNEHTAHWMLVRLPLAVLFLLSLLTQLSTSFCFLLSQSHKWNSDIQTNKTKLETTWMK